MKKYVLPIVLLNIFFGFPSWAYAAPFNTKMHPSPTPIPVRSIARPSPKKQSFLAKAWSMIGPPILGSAGVAAGAGVAWYTLQKKKKTFTTYYEHIAQTQHRYLQTIQAAPATKAQARAAFKKELVLIQEEAELTAAQKRLDQEQLTAIINKIQRMMDEASS